MDIQEIEVFIDKNGQVKIMVRGASGTQCLDLTSDLESILGGQILSRELTYEARIAEEQTQTRRSQQINQKSYLE